MRTHLLALASTMLAGMIVGCFSDPVGQTCPAGAEGCECADDFTCEPGLVCMSGYCQADDATGDTSGDGDGDTETGEERCGNDVLDPDEECDGGPGCTNCELDNYQCNPLNNAGCLSGTKCSYIPPNYDVACLQFDPDPPYQWGEGSCYEWEPRDEACDLGLRCTPWQDTNQCEDGGCCTYYCSILDENFDCVTPGDTCTKFFVGPEEPEGLEWLGFCSSL